MPYRYLHQLLEAQDWLRHPGVVMGSTTDIPSHKRRQLIRKKGSACVLCNTRQNLTVDHKLARSLGGTNEKGNLQVLCRPCNQLKAAEEAQLLKMLQTEEGRKELLAQYEAMREEGKQKGEEKNARRIANRELAYQILHGKKEGV
jgi:hypothetical protein